MVKLSLDGGCVQSWAINRPPITSARILASRRNRSLVCDGAFDILCQWTRRLRLRHDDSYHGGAVDHGVDAGQTGVSDAGYKKKESAS